MAGITIPLITEFKDTGIKQAMKEFKDLETTGEKAQFALKKAALPAIAALGALAVAAGKALSAGEAVSTANSRIEQINVSMGLFGASSEAVTDRLITLAEVTAMQTGMDNLSIKATEAKLLTFKNLAMTADEVGGAFDRAMLAAIDLAAAGFGTAESNAVQLGKALENPIKGMAALSKSGVTFTEVEKEKIAALVESGGILQAQEIILKAVETQVGNTAVATANSSDIMKEGFAQFQQQLGLALLPVLEAVTPILLTMANWAKDNPGVFLAIAGTMGVLAVSILAVNAAMLLNPAIAITAGIVALGAAVVVAYKKFEGFRNVVDAVFAAVKAAVNFGKKAWEGYVAYVEYVLAIATKVFQFFRNDVWGVIKQIVTGVKSIMGGVVDALIAPFKAAFNGIARAWNNTVGKFSFTVPSWVPGGLGGKGFSMPDIPYLADGGIVTGPTLAMIGEKGPEAVIPLTGRNAGSGGTTYITINTGADPQAVVRALQNYNRTIGAVPLNTRGF